MVRDSLWSMRAKFAPLGGKLPQANAYAKLTDEPVPDRALPDPDQPGDCAQHQIGGGEGEQAT
jgi:hypothetical protein